MSRPFLSATFWSTLALAFLLAFWPLRGEAAAWRPLFPFMAVIFWLLVEPEVLDVGFAWLVGLAFDLLGGWVLGQHALALAVCGYLLLSLRAWIANFGFLHLVAVVALLGIVHQLVVATVAALAGRAVPLPEFFYPVITSALLWPAAAALAWRCYRPETEL
ncbi:MAG: rod shape-determining protein MreD [Porticoccaceae bacterium]|nr:MAG: rod shape-determining protein MreD [Porticoccaceae bacterium]